MKMKVLFPLLAGILLLVSSCQKEILCKETPTCGICIPLDGTISYDSPAVDGCGWVIHSTDTTIYPEDIPEEFRINDKKVSITIIESSSVRICGLGFPAQESIICSITDWIE